MSFVNEIPKTGYGKITRQFTVWCGVCGNWEMESANNIDLFIEMITNGPRAKWRLTRDQGWCHKSCCRMMPTTLKFNAPLQPNTPST